jgi:3-hydroxyacyl-CoA dehydrogenase
LSDTAVLATNTSYLDLDLLAEPLKCPDRLVGLHFFNPPDRNPLVEIIAASVSSPEAVGVVVYLAGRLGKTVIPAGRGEGFVANRVYADYRNQAEFLLEDGATPREVDQAMESLGLPIGPFAVADMSGLDIAWARRKRLAPTRVQGQRYVHIPDRLCEAGRLGKKAGHGWYDYPDGVRRGAESPQVAEIIHQERLNAGIQSRALSVLEIQQRILGAMICAATSLVDRGIAARASDIDVALTEGFAFPKWLGGPLRYAASQPDSWVIDALAQTYRSCPETYSLAQPANGGEMPAEVSELLHSLR